MPIKIDGFNAQRSSARPMGHADGVRAVASTDTDFSTALGGQRKALSDEDMTKLLRMIDRQGARLSKTPTYDELKSYRTLVKQFIGEAVSRMYMMHTQAGWDHLGRQKVYTTVRKIDRKMEEMAEKIRLGQADQLSIVASQDAIRGMLVDLYM